MKLKFELVEKFPPPRPGTKGTKIIHFDKHVKKYGWNDELQCEEFDIEDIPDADTYEDLADELALTPCNTSDHHTDENILGFIESDGYYIKYNRTNRRMVIYKPDRHISNGVRLITLYLATGLGKYLELKSENYKSEIK